MMDIPINDQDSGLGKIINEKEINALKTLLENPQLCSHVKAVLQVR